MSEKIDLEKLRKEYKNDYIPTEEDLKLAEEQKKIGEVLDSAFKREMELRNNPDIYQINDYTKILYRLPITEEQRESIFKTLITTAKGVVE